MVTFFDIISFFGVASLFAWLGYGPLLSERNASRGLGVLTDYFMFSFWFYSVSAAFDYLRDLSQSHLPFSITYMGSYRFWMGIAVVGAFVLGTETLVVASYYVRQFGKTKFKVTEIPAFGFVIRITYLQTFSLISTILGFVTSLTFVGYSNFIFWAIVSWFYAFRYARSWRNPQEKYVKWMTIPVIVTFLWLVVSEIMYRCCGWPY